MTLGRRRHEQQDTFWVVADQLGSGPRNAFYDRLNQLLTEIVFDRKLEQAAEPFYKSTGRKGLPPGIYFRMIFIGYFEDISSQRGIGWRCEDSRSLARFLGYCPGESTPKHSSRSVTRERLPMELHALAFELILAAAKDSGLLKGKTVSIDATDLETNASLKSIVRKDNGDDWRAGEASSGSGLVFDTRSVKSIEADMKGLFRAPIADFGVQLLATPMRIGRRDSSWRSMQPPQLGVEISDLLMVSILSVGFENPRLLVDERQCIHPISKPRV